MTTSRVNRRMRLVPSLAVLLAAAGLAATGASSMAGAAPLAASAPGVGSDAATAAHSRANPLAPGPEVKRRGHVRIPVNPPDSPPIPVGRQARNTARGVKSVVAQNCYLAGQDGYQSGCQNPGFAGNPHTHWSNEPYYATNHRYVWVVDELGPSREREWLQFTVNQFNSAATGNRPYFLYVTGEQMGWSGCQQNQRQFIVVCYQAGQRSANTSWYETATGHMTQTAMKIGDQARYTNDYYVGYSIAHEFGHALGFAHDTDCASVMTYCSTVGKQYLWYGPNQMSVYTSLYDGHAS